MLPGNAYYDKEGNFLGYYEYKAWGTFFPFNNKIWSNVEELFSFLEVEIGIEYVSIAKHFFKQKNKQKFLIKFPELSHANSFQAQLFSLSVKGPPWPKGEKEYSLKIGN